MTTTYMEMSHENYNKVCSYIYKTYPNACVCWIEIIDNEELLNRFNQTKNDYIKKKKEFKEMELFHGTSEESARSIIFSGFKAEYNKVSAFGLGTYFSTRAGYSRQYARPSVDGLAFMFVCDVIVGKYTQGSSRLKIDTNQFDCAVDNLKKPDMYILPNDHASFPKYLVSFYPNATV